MIRLIIADDHDLFVEGMKEILARRSDIEFAGQVHDGIQAVEQTSLLNPDIVLMDIAMPRLRGIKASHQIREKFPDVKILMLSMHNSRKLITESLKAGAMGYLLRECSSDELSYAVNSVINGKYYITHSSMSIILDDYMRLLKEEEKKSPFQLSEREAEVLSKIAEGKNTVNAHRRHIMDKTGCNSIAGLRIHTLRDKGGLLA